MINPNLTAKAKGLMAYFYALAGNGTGAFPTKKAIQKQLGISNTAYYNALHQLEENNYLTITQRKSEGKFEQNEYIITNFTSSQNQDTQGTEQQNQNTNNEEEKTPNTQICDNNNNISLNNNANQPTPSTQNQDIEDVEKCSLRSRNEDTEPTPSTQKCDIQNCDNNNNNKVFNKNNISLNKYHISSSKSKVCIKARSKSDKLIARIKELCYYDDMMNSFADKSFKAIYNTTVTALISLATKPFTHRTEKISENDIHNLIKLSTRDDTYGLSLRDLLYTVIDKFIDIKDEYTIHNITGYLKNMLYTEMLVGEF